MINSTISFIEENNAGNAAAALMARLAPKTKVCLPVILLYFYNHSMHGTSCPEADEKVVVLVLCSENAPRGYLSLAGPSLLPSNGMRFSCMQLLNFGAIVGRCCEGANGVSEMQSFWCLVISLASSSVTSFLPMHVFWKEIL